MDSKLRCPHIHSAYDGDGPLCHASQNVLEKATPFSLTQRNYVANGGNLRAPIVVDLDPTTFCNLACPECISSPVLATARFNKERLS
ncbi:MAG: hypothetical protein Q8M58_00320, partial [Anaerolineales bacterium]|nr:hypothetical protein [Anaerolineales bacterium]